MQDDNLPCKGTIQYPRWHLLSAKEQFNMRPNISRCKMTHKSPREQFKMRCDNLIMHSDNATFDAIIQHACENWVLKQPALLAPGSWTDPEFFSRDFPAFFLLCSLCCRSACHLCFLHDERGREGCFFYITGMDEQLLAPVYIGKFYSLFSQKLIRQIVLKWTHASWSIFGVFTHPQNGSQLC